MEREVRVVEVSIVALTAVWSGGRSGGRIDSDDGLLRGKSAVTVRCSSQQMIATTVRMQSHFIKPQA